MLADEEGSLPSALGGGRGKGEEPPPPPPDNRIVVGAERPRLGRRRRWKAGADGIQTTRIVNAERDSISHGASPETFAADADADAVAGAALRSGRRRRRAAPANEVEGGWGKKRGRVYLHTQSTHTHSHTDTHRLTQRRAHTRSSLDQCASAADRHIHSD